MKNLSVIVEILPFEFCYLNIHFVVGLATYFQSPFVRGRQKDFKGLQQQSLKKSKTQISLAVKIFLFIPLTLVTLFIRIKNCF